MVVTGFAASGHWENKSEWLVCSFTLRFWDSPSPAQGGRRLTGAGDGVKLLRKVGAASVAQFAVRSDVVVAPPEVFVDHARLGQRPHLFTVRAFVAEAAMEAFHKAILPRATETVLMQFSASHSCTTLAMDSDPLSLRRYCGSPCSSLTGFSTAPPIVETDTEAAAE
jgi:hypothetical protein